VEELRKGGIIVEINSPWSSPLLVVKKRQTLQAKEKWRLVIDYRKVN